MVELKAPLPFGLWLGVCTKWDTEISAGGLPCGAFVSVAKEIKGRRQGENRCGICKRWRQKGEK